MKQISKKRTMKSKQPSMLPFAARLSGFSAAMMLSHVASAQDMGQMERTQPWAIMIQEPIISAGFGLSEFTEGTIETLADRGVNWDVRAIWGKNANLGFELAYIGASYDVKGPLGQEETLVGNGIETSLRLNFLPATISPQALGAWQPYVTAGLAWKNYQLGEIVTDNGEVRTRSSDDTLEIPISAGLAFHFPGQLMVDARAAYRASFYNDLVRQGNDSLDNWDVTGRLGWAF